MNDPGLGGCLVLTSLAPVVRRTSRRRARPRTSRSRARTTTSRSAAARSTTCSSPRPGPRPSPGTCRNTIDLVLRNSALHLGSMVDQAIALSPTFVFLENVGNDYLGAVLSGTFIDGVTITPVASFTADTNAALAKLKAKQPKGIVFGVADVTSIPFTTTLPPFLTSGGKLVLESGDGRADPAPRAEGMPDRRPRLPDPGDDARDAQRRRRTCRSGSASRARSPRRCRSATTRCPPRRTRSRTTPAPSSTRPTSRSSSSVSPTTTRRSRRPRPRTATSSTT